MKTICIINHMLFLYNGICFHVVLLQVPYFLSETFHFFLFKNKAHFYISLLHFSMHLFLKHHIDNDHQGTGTPEV